MKNSILFHKPFWLVGPDLYHTQRRLFRQELLEEWGEQLNTFSSISNPENCGAEIFETKNPRLPFNWTVEGFPKMEGATYNWDKILPWPESMVRHKGGCLVGTFAFNHDESSKIEQINMMTAIQSSVNTWIKSECIITDTPKYRIRMIYFDWGLGLFEIEVIFDNLHFKNPDVRESSFLEFRKKLDLLFYRKDTAHNNGKEPDPGKEATNEVRNDSPKANVFWDLELMVVLLRLHYPRGEYPKNYYSVLDENGQKVKDKKGNAKKRIQVFVPSANGIIENFYAYKLALKENIKRFKGSSAKRKDYNPQTLSVDDLQSTATRKMKRSLSKEIEGLIGCKGLFGKKRINKNFREKQNELRKNKESKNWLKNELMISHFFERNQMEFSFFTVIECGSNNNNYPASFHSIVTGKELDYYKGVNDVLIGRRGARVFLDREFYEALGESSDDQSQSTDINGFQKRLDTPLYYGWTDIWNMIRICVIYYGGIYRIHSHLLSRMGLHLEAKNLVENYSYSYVENSIKLEIERLEAIQTASLAVMQEFSLPNLNDNWLTYSIFDKFRFLHQVSGLEKNVQRQLNSLIVDLTSDLEQNKNERIRTLQRVATIGIGFSFIGATAAFLKLMVANSEVSGALGGDWDRNFIVMVVVAAIFSGMVGVCGLLLLNLVIDRWNRS